MTAICEPSNLAPNRSQFLKQSGLALVDRRLPQKEMRDVVAVRAEGDQVLQLRFLRLFALAQGIQVVGLDDFVVVVEPAGDAGEAVALLRLEDELAAAAEPVAGDCAFLAFQFGGGFLLAQSRPRRQRPPQTAP